MCIAGAVRAMQQASGQTAPEWNKTRADDVQNKITSPHDRPHIADAVQAAPEAAKRPQVQHSANHTVPGSHQAKNTSVSQHDRPQAGDAAAAMLGKSVANGSAYGSNVAQPLPYSVKPNTSEASRPAVPPRYAPHHITNASFRCVSHPCLPPSSIATFIPLTACIDWLVFLGTVCPI